MLMIKIFFVVKFLFAFKNHSKNEETKELLKEIAMSKSPKIFYCSMPKKSAFAFCCDLRLHKQFLCAFNASVETKEPNSVILASG